MAKVLTAVEHDLGSLFVKRVLPHQEKAMVGPFIFFDQMGLAHFLQSKASMSDRIHTLVYRR